MPLELAAALVGWITARYGDRMLDRATAAVFGSQQERALRAVVRTAIDEVVAGTRLTANQSQHLADVLHGGPDVLLPVSELPTLAAATSAWLAAVNEPPEPGTAGYLDGLGLRVPALAEALTASVAAGMARDALASGPLTPIVEAERFDVLRRLAEDAGRRIDGLGALEDLVKEMRFLLEQVLDVLEEDRRTATRTAEPEATGAFAALVRARSRDFVGRRYLDDELDRFLASSGFPSGYVFIVGEPGIGKTSFAAHLVDRHGWIHHFNSVGEGIVTTRAFLASVSGQLQARYGPGPGAPPAADTAELSSLLGRAAAQATAESPLVLVIDALDEAEEPVRPGVSRLALPRTLPEHTYLVITTRPGADYEVQVDERRELVLRDDDERNLADVRAYVERNIDTESDALQPLLGSWRMTRASLADLLVARSQGNFMYVVHVLGDVRRGLITPETIDHPDSLPVGLHAYYEAHWRILQDRWPARLAARFDTGIRCLVAMREPASPATLADLAPDDIDIGFARLVIHQWRQFLNATRFPADRGRPAELRYYVYHLSFRDFLENHGPGLEPTRQAMYERGRDLLHEWLEAE